MDGRPVERRIGSRALAAECGAPLPARPDPSQRLRAWGVALVRADGNRGAFLRAFLVAGSALRESAGRLGSIPRGGHARAAGRQPDRCAVGSDALYVAGKLWTAAGRR